MKRVNKILNHVSNSDPYANLTIQPTSNSQYKNIEHGGYLFAKTLLSCGVNCVYTLTGGHISPILVGCNQIGIRVIDVRDEVTTVFAADAIGRMTGLPGVAIVTAGPGLTNTITAVKNAQMAESPCIIIGGATSMLLKGRGSLQDIDQQALMKPHCKAMFSLTKVRDIITVVRKAYFLACDGVPGPVFIEVPLEIIWPRSNLDGNMDTGSGKWSLASLYVKYHVHSVFKDAFKDIHNIDAKDQSKYITSKPMNNYSSFTNKQMSLIINKLLKAKSPLLVLGSQAMIHPTMVKQLIKCVELLQIPIYLSGMSRGLLGANHPLYFRHKRTLSLQACDVLLLCGVSLDFRLGYGRSINKKAFFVHVNLDHNKITINSALRKRNLGLTADPCAFVLRLTEYIRKYKIDWSSTKLQWNDWVNELKKREYKRELGINKDAMKPTNGRVMNSVKLCRVINELLNESGDDTYLIADGGDFVGTASYIVKPRMPLHWLDPGAFGTLGCGAGFAIGAKTCYPDATVVLLYGDGSFGWSICEFDTMRRHKLGCIAIIGNDSCWHQMYRDQVKMLKDTTATLLAEETKYEEVVKGFGCKGFQVRNEEEFAKSFRECLVYAKQGIPCVINVFIAKSKFREGSISL